MKMKSKRITMEGRNFQIDFWTDYAFNPGLPYYRVSEVKVFSIRKYLFFGNYVEHEFLEEICEHWTNDSRVKCAQNSIKLYLLAEKEKFNEREEVENFCNQING